MLDGTVLYLWGVLAATIVTVADVVVKERLGKHLWAKPHPVEALLSLAVFWWVATPYVGPWWAIATVPALLILTAFLFAAAALAGERLAKRRVLRREGGR